MMMHPLDRKRILITRPSAQSAAFVAALRAVGAVPILFPTIALMPIQDNHLLDTVLHRLAEFDWVIFTSVNGVRYVLGRMTALGILPQAINQARVAVIGPATAASLTQYGVQVDLQPDRFVAEALFEALKAHASLANQRFLLLRAEVARPMLREALTAQGAQVEEVPVYHTVAGTPTPDDYNRVRAGIDIFTFTSPLTITYFCELLGDEARQIAQDKVVACIGPITAHALEQTGLPFRHKIVADEYTVPGVMNTLTEFYRQQKENVL